MTIALPTCALSRSVVTEPSVYCQQGVAAPVSRHAHLVQEGHSMLRSDKEVYNLPCIAALAMTIRLL